MEVVKINENKQNENLKKLAPKFFGRSLFLKKKTPNQLRKGVRKTKEKIIDETCKKDFKKELIINITCTLILNPYFIFKK